MMKRFLSALLATTALVLPGVALAQSPPIQTQAVAPLNPNLNSFWVGQANGATSCNAVSQTAAQDTITITPPAGQYVYLTALAVQFSTDATGATAVPTISTTNLGNLNAGLAPFLSAATTLSTTGYHADMVINFPVGGLKSAAPTTAVTIVPSATLGAHSILCMSAVGYTGP